MKYLTYLHLSQGLMKTELLLCEEKTWALSVAQPVKYVYKPLACCSGLYPGGEAEGLIAQLQKCLCTISPLIKSAIMCPSGTSRA